MNEVSSSALLHIQLTLLWVCGVDSYPRIRTFVEKHFHCFFSNKKTLNSGGSVQVSRGFVIEMKLRSTSFAKPNFPDKISWITWTTKQNLEIWPFLKSDLETPLWESGRNLVLLPSLHFHNVQSWFPKTLRWGEWMEEKPKRKKLQKVFGTQPHKKQSWFASIPSVGLGVSRTNADSQWNPVYKVLHSICCCGNEMIRQ